MLHILIDDGLSVAYKGHAQQGPTF